MFRPTLIATVLWLTTPALAWAEIGCEGVLQPKAGGTFTAVVRCTHTENTNNFYTCKGAWRLKLRGDVENRLNLTVQALKGDVKVGKWSNDKIEGRDIIGEYHPYEGSCEL